jgi:fructokinase
MGQIVCFGEMLIDFVALERNVSVGYANQFEKAAGGAPANVAVGLARLGIPTAFITQLGDDPFGHYLFHLLQQNLVDTSGIAFSNDALTALAFVSIDHDGERSFAFYRKPSADMLIRPEQLAIPLLSSCKIFHLGSISLINEPVRSTALKAIEIAKNAGAIISYDPNLRLALWDSEAEALQGLMQGFRQAHLVKMNIEELEFLTGQQGLSYPQAIFEASRGLWHKELQLLVITRGGDGCIAITSSRYWESTGFSVTVEDTIGAGDGFMAGLLSGILPLIHPQTKMVDAMDTVMIPLLLRANAVGALTTTQRGGIPALPDETTVQAFLQTATLVR